MILNGISTNLYNVTSLNETNGVKRHLDTATFFIKNKCIFAPFFGSCVEITNCMVPDFFIAICDHKFYQKGSSCETIFEQDMQQIATNFSNRL